MSSLFDNIENIKLLRNLLNPEEQGQDDSDLEDVEESLVKNNISKSQQQQQNMKDKNYFVFFFLS